MLSFENRLKRKKDFQRVYDFGKLVSVDCLLLKFFNSHEKETRFGFVVSKKTEKKATKRNRIKRILRNHSRLLIPTTKKGFDIVVIAKKKAKKLNQKKIIFSLEEALRIAKLTEQQT